MKNLAIWMQSLLATLPGKLGAFGPYLLVELLLPGGSLLALLLWAVRHRHAKATT